MYALHELLCTDGRVLNRHAQKMYGFIPGIVTAVHDPKQKRHQRGYVKVHFPGLQDVSGPEAPILPWARLCTPNAGGTIESHSSHKETKTVTVWETTYKTETVEVDVIVEEPIYEDKEEVTITRDPLPDLQERLDIHFTVDHPNTGEMDFPPSIFQSGSDAEAKAKCKAFVAKLKAFMDKVDWEAAGIKKLDIFLDAHTSSTGSFEHNQGLSQRRAKCMHHYLTDAINDAGEEVSGRVLLHEAGYGRNACGEIRDKSNPKQGMKDDKDGSHAQGYARCKKTQHPPGGQDAPSIECTQCRRADVTLAHHGELVGKPKKTTKKTKVVVGYKKKVEKKKITRKVPELKAKTKTIEVDVPDEGKPAGTGFYCPPQIGDEVVCAFEHGDMHHPYILGSVWNGKAKLPEPSTPADDKRDKKGPQTKPMKGDSLCGGGGKNKIGYFKSRTGNLVSLDDQNGVVRIQDRTGMSTIQLSAGKVEIMQSTQDIYLFAKETIRFDCKDFIVEAKKNIWQHASNNYGIK
ncbi:MAG TPA: phage baseplate assembly protein V, partial [Planctomycetota bacterium]|nr:phage baseplate assembly protein V [Planctomycetota bacterium]